MGWKEYFQNHIEPIKFIYVDGPHQYQDVKDQLEAIKPRLVKGAYVIGDDYYSDEIKNAFNEILPGSIVHPDAPHTTGIYINV
jgi:hypothetical protein